MRIGIDIHSIGSQKGGNETYYRELIKELVKIRSEHRFLLYHSTPEITKYLNVSNQFSLKHIFPSHRTLRIPFSMPLRAHLDNLDLFHAQFIVPPFLKCKKVTTIPDIAFEHHPQFFSAYQRAWSKVLIRDSAKKADHIITVSEYSKRDLVETYGIHEEKITVTYEGAGKEFVPLDREKSKSEIARKYKIDGDFILYLGRLQARKNLRRLVNAYARVREAGFTHSLVLAGQQDSFFQPVLARVRELKLENNISFPGYVAAEDVPTFYNAAEVFIYPSLYEGFGLPLMEAMACGIPVITSRGSSLDEVAGDAAVLVDPLDELSISEALKNVLNDSELRTRLSVAGLRRSRLFTFENAARQTLDVYERVLGAKINRATEDLQCGSQACL
jgi:glycosyltransferase involved in cell wall biosynthesis